MTTFIKHSQHVNQAYSWLPVFERRRLVLALLGGQRGIFTVFVPHRLYFDQWDDFLEGR